MSELHFVDLCFPIKGTVIPADSSYHLYAALSGLLPDIHDKREIGIHAIKGTPARDRTLTLTGQSKVILRLPQSELMRYMLLAGQQLQLGESNIRLQGAFLRPLVPAPRLYSRLTVIKGHMEPDSFLQAARRQLEALEIRGEPQLIAQPEIAAENQDKTTGSRSPWLRRTVQIKENRFVGFALRVQDLTAEESLRLQEKGLGGKRHFGCGIFVVDRG